METQYSLRNYRNLLACLLICIPVIVYLGYGYSFSGPIFYGDEFDLLETVTLLPETGSLSGKMHLWYKQQNEHRVVFPRLVTFLDYVAEGYIHWRILALIGNLVWVSVLLVFWHAFRTLNLSAWYFIPVTWILLQPQYYENVIWATSILQQSDVVVWVSLTVFLYAKGHYRWTFLTAILATFTHGSGLCSFIIIGILMMLDRQWKRLPLWTGAFVVVVVLYLYGLDKGQNANFQNSLADPARLATAFFAFFGSLTRVIIENPLAATCLGFLMMAVILTAAVPPVFHALRTARPLTFFDKLLLGNLLLLLASAALVSISRSWAGLENMMPPRYQHYPAFVAGWTYLVLLAQLQPRIRTVFAMCSIVAGLLFNGLCYLVYHPNVQFMHRFLVADETNYLNHQYFLRYHWTFNRNIRDTYDKAFNRGVVRMQRRLPSPDFQGAPADTSGRLVFSTTPAAQSGDKPLPGRRGGYLWINGSTGQESPPEFLYFTNGATPGYWLPVRNPRPAFRDLLLGKFKTDSYASEVSYDNLPPGDYHVGILRGGQFFRTPYNLSLAAGKLADTPALSPTHAAGSGSGSGGPTIR